MPIATNPINMHDFSTQLREYEQQGYTIIPDLFSANKLEQARKAADRAVEKARAGQWDRVRRVGKQYPPFDKGGSDIWGIQHIMHPDLEEPTFIDIYGDKKFLDVCRRLLGCEEESLQLELFNMLINPNTDAFSLGWHRDDVKATADEEEERERLAITHYGVQWNTALYDDACLEAVPASHRRIRSPEEREASLKEGGGGDMPGAGPIRLRAGETVFYNNNLIHRGVYNPATKRRTLHGCLGSTVGGSARARGVLQHDLEWAKEESFGAMLPPQLKRPWSNLREMGQGTGEFSQDDV